MKNIKIVFIDLDGTLRDSSGKISEKYKILFDKLKKIGIKIVFCTGRGKMYTESLCKLIGTSSYCVTSNGALIHNYLNDNIIYKSIISKDDLIYLNKLIEENKYFFVANTCSNSSYTNKDFDNIGKKKIDKLININEEVNQVVIQDYSMEKLDILNNELDKSSTIKIINRSRNINSSKLFFCDITNKNVSKGNGVKILCDYLGIDRKYAMAIGDGDNDVDMLDSVDIKVAMGNGSENIMEKASIITLSNDQFGVYIVLDRLYNEIISR